MTASQGSGSGKGIPRERWIGPLLFLFFLVVALPFVKTHGESWNDYSHAAAVESLVERGTWVINRSPWAEDTGDKIRIGNRFYSDKLPLLAVLGATAYAYLKQEWNLSLTPDCDATGRPCAYYWLAALLVTLPAAFMPWLMYSYALQEGAAVWASIFAALALGIGTMLFPFSLVLNHHVPAAVSLLAALYLLRVALRTEERRPAALFGAGFFAALAASFDLPAAIFGVALFGIALVRYRLNALYFVFGGVLPVAATIYFDYQISGTFLPPQLVPNAFNYPGSPFPATVGGIEASADIPRYAFDMLVGDRGLYAYNPILLFGAFAVLYVLLRREHPLHVEALFIGVAFALLTVYLVFSTDHFGGVAYGERLYLSGIPLIFSFVIFAPPFVPSRVGKIVWMGFAAALVLSGISVGEGVLHPWGVVIPPPIELSWSAAPFPLGIRENLVSLPSNLNALP